MASKATCYRLRRLLNGHVSVRPRRDGATMRVWVWEVSALQAAKVLALLGPHFVTKAREVTATRDVVTMLLAHSPRARYTLQERKTLLRARKRLQALRRHRRAKSEEEWRRHG